MVCAAQQAERHPGTSDQRQVVELRRHGSGDVIVVQGKMIQREPANLRRDGAEMELLCRLSVVSFDSLPVSGGMVPEMELWLRSSHSSCESSPVSGGMVPEMEL